MAPRACQAEHSVQQYFDDLHKRRAEAEIGVLVGKPSVGSRDILLALIRTPPQEYTGEEALSVSMPADGGSSTSSSKPKKGAASVSSKTSGAATVTINLQWVAAHASEVARLLPGGLAVLGLYLFAPEAAHAAATGQLSTALTTIHREIVNDTPKAVTAAAAAAAAATGAGTAGKAEGPELLLLFVGIDSRKQSLRSCQVGKFSAEAAAAAAAALRPCELKYGSALSSLVCLTASHALDSEVPATSADKQLQQALQAAADAEVARIVSCVAAIDGRVPDEAAVLNEVVPASASISEPVSVQLYCSPRCCSSGTNSSSSNSSRRSESASTSAVTASTATTASCYGRSRLSGHMHGIAIVHKRESVAKALAHLKADLANSLHLRVAVDIHTAKLAAEDAAEQAAERAAGAAGGAGAAAAGKAAKGVAPVPHELLTPVDCKQVVSWPLMRRVLLPWQSGMAVTSYLADGEPLSALVQMTAFMVGEGIEQTSEVEAPGVSKAPKPASKTKALPAASKQVAVASTEGPCSNSVIMGLGVTGSVAVVAGLLGLWLGSS